MNKIFKTMRKRGLLQNWKLFLSVVSIMVLATTLLFGFVVNYYTLHNSINGYYQKSNIADLWITTDNISADDENFFISQKINSDKRFFYETNVNIENSTISSLAKIYVGDSVISKPVLESGSFGCLIDKKIAQEKKLYVGASFVEIDYIYNDYSIQMPLKLRFQITGTMSFVECASSYSTWPIVIGEKQFEQSIVNALKNQGLTLQGYTIPFNQILVKTENINETKSQIINYYENSSNKLLSIIEQDALESVVLLNTEKLQAQKMIYVFPIVFLIVAVLIILTTLNQLILLDRYKIGTLKSIGISNKKILIHYSGFGVYTSAIGSVIGLVLGIMIIPNIMFVKYDLLYSIPESCVKLYVPWFGAILSFCLVVGLAFVISLFACLSILKHKPIECLKNSTNIKLKSRKNNKLKNFPMAYRMSFRNLKIKPIRTLMTGFGIAGCIALLLCGFGIKDTIDNSLNNDFKHLFNYDLSATYTNSSFEEELTNIEGIEKTEYYKEFYCKVKFNSFEKNVLFLQIENNSTLTNLNLKENSVAMSKSIAEELSIKAGDKIKIYSNNNFVELVVEKIIETAVINRVFVNFDIGVVPNSQTNGVYIKCDNQYKLKENLNAINTIGSVMTLDEMYDSANSKIDSINVMTTTLMIFAIILAVVVLINFVFLILSERIKEIATLKVIGESLSVITISLVLEISIITLFSTVFGMICGYPLLLLVLSINKVEIINFLYKINVSSYIFTILLIIAVVLIIMIISSIKVQKTKMIENLKSME